MHAKDAIRSAGNLTTAVLKSYVSDLDDADLMRRPGTGCNHLAWQLGHLISSEAQLLNMMCPGAAAELPDGFAEAHGKDQASSDNAGQFHDKQTYLKLYDQVRASTEAALEALDDADLDKPAPEDFRQFCPTLGDMFVLTVSHGLMHAGQFVVVRRQAGKPILM